MPSHCFLALIDQACWIELQSEAEQLLFVGYACGPGETPPPSPLFQEAQQQISAYLQGKLKVFDLPLRLKGPPFYQRVWQALLEIPYGHKVSYKELAQRVGNPKAARAVGGANRSNPLPLLVPCHRVVAQGKALGPHYSFGGQETQRHLLAMEARHATL